VFLFLLANIYVRHARVSKKYFTCNESVNFIAIYNKSRCQVLDRFDRVMRLKLFVR
jgi:hypothetical protein